jgi:NAD(P)-dependent dehydrogenase (short-subunit alcohol dehydrogenase family)
MSDSVFPTIVVTGATSGIGYFTARRLLDAGASVIVHGATVPSAEEAAARLVAGGADPVRVRAVAADFSRFEEVTAMARALSAAHHRIDVLVHNAAIAGPQRRTVTEDGNELTFQVNYLAPYLLTRLLTPHLRAARGRMVAVSSTLHRIGNINWADPQRTKSYSPVAAYAQSKLALTMFARAMAQEQVDVTAVSVQPGVVEGGLLPIYGRVGGPVDEAAAVVARLGWPQVEVLNGAYYDGLAPATPAPLVDNPGAVSRLRKLSSRIIGQYRFAVGRAA